MRILHLAPLWYPIAINAPGGIETFLAELTSLQAASGQEVALICSGDTHTVAHVIAACDRGIVDKIKANEAAEYQYFEQHLLRLALANEGNYDIIHSHIGSVAYVLSGIPGMRNRVLHTIHGPVLRDMQWFIRTHQDMWFSTVSAYQAHKLWNTGARRCEVVNNGIDLSRFKHECRSGDGLLFLGRMEPEKGADAAIRVARDLVRPLVLAGPITNIQYFKSLIEPELNEQIRYVGIADHVMKVSLLGNAQCLLVPSRVEEAFGMVCIEAAACGTPVIALASGALPEIVEPGVTGFLATKEDDLAPLAAAAQYLDRQVIRARAQRFAISGTAAQYTRLYEQILNADAEAANA